MTTQKDAQLVTNPIGFIRTVMSSKFQAPHQPSDANALPGTIELLPHCNFEHALQDLEGFEYIWLLWHAHKNKSWRPKVLPPRGEAKRRGVFATRSPHRPNAIGLTAVRLLRIEGRTLSIGECDLIDGTPILDIKPYIPIIDSFPNAKAGWTDELEMDLSQSSKYTIEISGEAKEQLGWLKTEWNIDFLSRAASLLERDPRPHRSRRITTISSNLSRIGCGPWRLIFSVSDTIVRIHAVAPGYPSESLHKNGHECIVDRDAQVEFYKRWGKFFKGEK